MAIVWIALYVLLLVLAGYAALALVWQGERRPLAEIVGFSLALGTGTVATLLFWASLLGFAPTRGLLLVGATAALGTIAGMGWTGRLLLPTRVPPAGLTRADWWLVIPVAVLVGMTGLVAVHALGFPFYEWDSFAIWGLKAKVVAHESLAAPRPAYFHDLTLSYSHPDYPLLTPFLLAGA